MNGPPLFCLQSLRFHVVGFGSFRWCNQYTGLDSVRGCAQDHRYSSHTTVQDVDSWHSPGPCSLLPQSIAIASLYAQRRVLFLSSTLHRGGLKTQVGQLFVLCILCASLTFLYLCLAISTVTNVPFGNNPQAKYQKAQRLDFSGTLVA